ncbi:6,7-dimethyl-8-ribityllumazine synthase [Candidatus Peregrinibacteria bacterium]|nr:6,7-dimethyl-8-ribityllumazine synthase [Candidatus Peregrinibacteria bacterium]
MSKHCTKNTLSINGSKLSIVIVVSMFNKDIVSGLLKTTVSELKKHKVRNIQILRVPGALEIPLTVQMAIKKYKPNAVIALGAVIKGETSHYEHVSRESIHGIMNVSLQTNTPIIQGILTTLTLQQARERIVLGTEYAQAALTMSSLTSSIT